MFHSDLFAIFADKVYNGDKTSDKSINDAWKENIIEVILGTPEASVGKLINFFDATDAGLSVMFRQISPINKSEDWSSKIVDNNGQYTNKKCN